MNSKRRKIIWNIIQIKGEQLLNKLPHDIIHPKGRNPYAHICSEIKKKFKCSYKDVDDKNFEKLIKYIEDIHE